MSEKIDFAVKCDACEDGVQSDVVFAAVKGILFPSATSPSSLSCVNKGLAFAITIGFILESRS